MTTMPQVNRTNGDWLDDIEDVVDGLRLRRAELRDQVYEADLEADDVWSSTERRWRRLEAKLRRAEAAPRASVNAARVRNVDRLLEAIDEAYYELERLID